MVPLSLPLTQLAAVFIALGIVIIIATRRLAATGSALAELTSLSGHLIGFTFFAIATSMPELVMAVSSILIVKDPNLCAGNVLGSNLFNLAILGVLALAFRRKGFIANIPPTMSRVILAQFLLALVPLYFILHLGPEWTFLRLSPASLLILVGYAWSLKLATPEAPQEETANKGSATLGRTLAKFLFLTLVIIIAAVELTRICDAVSTLTGIGNSFLGALLLASVSSLPEVVLCFSLVRMGQSSMALGNLLGSNFFNLMILPVADILMGGHFFRSIGVVHSIPVFTVGVMTLILLAALGRKKSAGTPTGVLLLLAYLVGMYLLYLFS